MANAILSAQQPDLNSFIVLPRLPEGCLPFIVPDDRVEPHLHAGDIAIIDPDDREPDHGDLFLVQFAEGRRQVVETRRAHNPQEIAGSDESGDSWQLCWTMSLRAVGGNAARTMKWGDGPYLAEAVTQKLVGRVVGILQPAYEEAKKVAA